MEIVLTLMSLTLLAICWVVWHLYTDVRALLQHLVGYRERLD